MTKADKERIVNLGEVKTPEKTVDDILNLFEDVNYKSRFFEPGCGDGNFLIKILYRKQKKIRSSIRSWMRECLRWILPSLCSLTTFDL